MTLGVNRPIRRNDRGEDVRALQQAANRVFEKRGFKLRVDADGEAGELTFRRVACAAALLGVSGDHVRKATRNSAGKQRLDERLQFLVRHPDQRTNAARKRGERATKAFRRKLEKARKNRANKRGRLSPHFWVAEFHCTDGTHVPSGSLPALRAVCRDYLEPLHRQYGNVLINSGYRTRSYNAAIGGASVSFHIYDLHGNACAADHICGGAAPSTVQRFHDSNTHPDGMGYYSGFTHVDNRNRVGYGDSRWYGAG